MFKPLGYLEVRNAYQQLRLLYNRDVVPVITVPKYVEARVKQREKRKRQIVANRDQYLQNCGDKSKPIITCTHSSRLNHYLRQRYAKDKKVPLASEGWKNGKYKGHSITINPHGPNPHFEETDRFNYTFQSTGLGDKTIESLKLMGYFKPTQCQFKTIPELIKGQNVILSSETGSGKTLAYLSPIIEKLITAKAKGDAEIRQPNALIVLPSRELVHQIGGLARQFGSLTELGVAPMVGGAPVALSHSGYDIIVTTIGLIGDHVQRGVYSLNQIKTLVIDEADTLLDDTFSYGVYDLLNDLKFKSSVNRFGTQICLVSATIPKNIEKTLGDFVDFDSFKRIETHNLHRLMPHVKHHFLRLHKFDRPNKLLELIGFKLRKNRRIVIFNRTRAGCEWMFHHLTNSGLQVSHLHKKMEESERITQLHQFNDEKCNLMVSTDLGSRGIDFKRVTDVINYDSPHHVSDYIHRSGRTGRVGCGPDCTVTTFICFGPDVDMLKKLEESVRRNVDIEDVDGNIRSILKGFTRNKLSKLSQIK